MPTFTKAMNEARKMRDKSLKESARSNTSLSVKNRLGTVDIKKGTPLDQSLKKIPQERERFGVSKGVTKNMDNYESLRVDVWLSDTVQEDETVQEAFYRVSVLLDEVMEEVIKDTLGE